MTAYQFNGKYYDPALEQLGDGLSAGTAYGFAGGKWRTNIYKFFADFTAHIAGLVTSSINGSNIFGHEALSSATGFALTNTNKRSLALTHTAAGQATKMPDATTITKGETWRVRHLSNAAALQDNAGGVLLASLGVGDEVDAWCEANGTAAGTWRLNRRTSFARTALDALSSLAATLLAGTSTAAMQTTLGLDGFVPRNFVVNGNFDVAQRAVLTTSANSLGDTIGSTAKLGKVDGWAVYSTAGTITAGSAMQDAAATFGQTGNALHVSGLTMTGSAKIVIATRIESADAKQLRNKAITVGLTMRHDIGSSKNVTITVNKPTAADNYAGVTQIAQSGALAVADATNVQVSLAISGATLGDCANGLEVIFELDCGAITTKNIRVVDAFCILGTAVPATFPAEPFPAMLARCQRYFEKTFPLAVAPVQNSANGSGAISYRGGAAGEFSMVWPFKVTKRATPTIITFNPAAANANWWDFSAGGSITASTQLAGDTMVQVLGTTSLPAGNTAGIHAVAKAEMF